MKKEGKKTTAAPATTAKMMMAEIVTMMIKQIRTNDEMGVKATSNYKTETETTSSSEVAKGDNKERIENVYKTFCKREKEENIERPTKTKEKMNVRMCR